MCQTDSISRTKWSYYEYQTTIYTNLTCDDNAQYYYDKTMIYREWSQS